jgi:hypothetical protein
MGCMLGSITTWQGRRCRRVRGGLKRIVGHMRRGLGDRNRGFRSCIQGVRAERGPYQKLSVGNVGDGFRGSCEDLGGARSSPWAGPGGILPGILRHLQRGITLLVPLHPVLAPKFNKNRRQCQFWTNKLGRGED